MNKNELLELIKNGENSLVEFKEEQVTPANLAGEIVAFANAEGGTILIGVNDEGSITGVKRKDIEEWVINISRNNCYPSLIPLFEKILLEEKTVAIITIPKREGIVHRTSDGRYFIRVGSTKRDATPEELARLFQAVGMMHHDVSPVYNSALTDIDRARVEEYFSTKLNSSLDKLAEPLERSLEDIKVAIMKDNKYFLTLAGLLLFGKNPEKFLTQAGITAVKFPGTEMDYKMVDKKEINGPLLPFHNSKGDVEAEGVIDQAIKFVQSHINVESKMEGVRRIETPQYPLEPIREGIVNAVAHRNYTITGSKIRLFIFSDRIEILSPGKLPNTVTIEAIRRTAHYTRNPVIYRFLEHYGYAEDVGLGVPQKIIKKMLDHNGKEPKLEESGEEFILTLFA